MGTNEIRLEKYINLWNEFERILEKKDLNLSSFSKKWEEQHQDEASDYKKFYNRIKKQKHQLKALTRAPQANTLIQIEEYIKFLDEKRVRFESLEDEKFGNLF